MSHRACHSAGLGLGGLALGLLAASSATNLGHLDESVLVVALAVTFSVVGALIASRHPGNAIGWIFLAVAVATGLGGVAGAYADHWLGGDGGSQTARGDRCLVRDPFLDPLHPGPLHVPPAAVPRRPPSVAPLEMGRVVRRRGDRGRPAHERAAARPVGGLPAAREPVRHRERAARSTHGARVPHAADRHRRLVCVARRQVPPRTGSVAPPDQVARTGRSVRRADRPDRDCGLRAVGGTRHQRREHARRPGPAPRRRDRDPAPPALRHRRRDQPDAGLRGA